MMNGGNQTGDPANAHDIGAWSATVRSRREAMLPLLKDAVVRERGRRQRRRIAARGAATLALLLAVGIPILMHRSESEVRFVSNQAAPYAPDRSPFRQVSILQSRPRAYERLARTRSVDPATYTVDDRGLVQTLAAIGRPTGLIRFAGGVRLTDPVTDRELRPPGSRKTATQPEPPNGAVEAKRSRPTIRPQGGADRPAIRR